MVKIIECKKCNNKEQHGAFGLCKKCYILLHKEECYNCKKYDKVARRIENKPYCPKCYCKLFKIKKECFRCKKIEIISKVINGNNICKKCYSKYFYVKEICSICKNIKRISRRINESPYCQSCFNNIFKKDKCSECNEVKIIVKKHNGNSFCNKCYEKLFKPKRECNWCKKIRIIAIKNNNLCKTCYEKYRLKNDEKFYILKLIRDRIRKALNSDFGKINVNYKAIIEHLGPCPGNREDYHIDHIIPISAFDFKYIELAFLPKNHQWLKKQDNLIKSNKFNKEDLDKYILENYNDNSS